MTDDELAAAVGATAAHELDSALDRIQHCLGQLTDEQVWQRTQPGMNSIGNLVLHLCDNLSGVDEEPVTGSAHCCLADFWRKRLGKTEFVAFQASDRSDLMKVRIVKDRALLGGRAVTVANRRSAPLAGSASIGARRLTSCAGRRRSAMP